MKLYNTLTKSLETFKPQDPENVKVYTCGPTVYDYAHIGNFTSYIYWALLVNTLNNITDENTGKKYHVNRVMNITDVGHLASDADDGIDKLEKGAKREHKTVWEIAEFYTDKFFEDFDALHLKRPEKICRATDYIDQDIELVDLLTAKGYTYETTDGIYFDTAKFPTYANFARLDLDHLRAGARVEFNNEKHNASDFALWKFIKPGEDHAMRWDYLGRSGYPGWHIECAAISHKELGFPLDIHTGGIDHIPVHHTNEIAESEVAFGVKMSNFWLHCNFITLDDQKISKSLGNVYTIGQLVEKGYEPLDFKMWVLQGHYQGTRNFNFADLSAAKTRRRNWQNRITRLIQGEKINYDNDFETKLMDCLSDNLNSAAAFALIDNFRLSLADWKLVEKIFGLGFSFDDISDHIKELIRDRSEARKMKDWATSDDIRLDLTENNIEVLDTPEGQIWQYIK